MNQKSKAQEIADIVLSALEMHSVTSISVPETPKSVLAEMINTYLQQPHYDMEYLPQQEPE